MEFWRVWQKRREQKFQIIYKSGPSQIALFFLGMAFVSWLVTIILSGSSAFAWMYYKVMPGTSETLANILASVRFERRADIVEDGQVEAEKEARALPPKDESLPNKNEVLIESLGVATEIWEAPFAEYERVLRKGVWRVPDFGTPERSEQPIILTAHRFGYLEWSNSYRRKNSFYNLPKLVAGDEVRLNWGQRQYLYRVVRVEEGEEITDYGVDLILYTCKFLVSPMKYFVYAERI